MNNTGLRDASASKKSITVLYQSYFTLTFVSEHEWREREKEARRADTLAVLEGTLEVSPYLSLFVRICRYLSVFVHVCHYLLLFVSICQYLKSP